MFPVPRISITENVVEHGPTGWSSELAGLLVFLPLVQLELLLGGLLVEVCRSWEHLGT